MALNLIELIKASGSSGISGQSFDGHVPGTTSGVKMSDYRISALSYTSYSSEGVTYNNTAQPSFTITYSGNVTRGAQASNIQRTTSSAWSVEMWIYSGSGIPTASIVSASAGSTFSATVQIDMPSDFGSTTIACTTTANGSQPSTYGDIWGGSHNYSTTYSGVASMQLALRLTYDPDTAAFNPTLNSQGAAGTTGATSGVTGGSDYLITALKQAGQVNQLETRWWDAELGDALTAANNNDTGSGTYRGNLANQTSVAWESYGASHYANINKSLYTRARLPGGNWTATLSAFAPVDTRNEA